MQRHAIAEAILSRLAGNRSASLLLYAKIRYIFLVPWSYLVELRFETFV